MKTLFLIFALFLTLKYRSQNFIASGPFNVSIVPDIPHEEKWVTGILSSSNLFVSYLNIKNFKKIEKKSNAGFLLFPGLVQLSVGTFKKRSDPGRNIDIALGASSALICIGRMVYKPKRRKEESLTIAPFYTPLKASFAVGFSFKLKI